MPPKRKATPEPDASRLLPRRLQPTSSKIINRLRLDLIIANLEVSPAAMALLADPTYESRVLLGEILASWYRRTIVEPDDSGGVPRDVYSVVVSHAARYPERFMLLLEVVEQRRRGEKGGSMVTEMQRSTALRSKAQRSPGVTGGRNLVVEDLGQEDMEMDLAETEEPCKVPVRDSSQHDETMGDAGPAVVSDHLHPPPPPPPPPPSLTPPTDSSKTQQSPPKVTAKEHRRRCLDAVLTKLSLSPNILSLIPEPDKLNEVERILKLWYRGVGGDFLEGSIYSAVVQHALLSDGSAKKYNAVLKAADRRKWAKGRGRAKSGKPLQEKE